MQSCTTDDEVWYAYLIIKILETEKKSGSFLHYLTIHD
jgi:hypothetical protein